MTTILKSDLMSFGGLTAPAALGDVACDQASSGLLKAYIAEVRSAAAAGAQFIPNNLAGFKQQGLTLVAAASVTSGTTNAMSLTGLDGNSDCQYLISGNVVTDSATRIIQAAINGGLTTFNEVDLYTAGSAAVTGQTSAAPTVCVTYTGKIYGQFFGVLTTRSGAARAYSGITMNGISSTPVIAYLQVSSWVWNDFSTNITSITIKESAGATAFAAGSGVQIYRLGRS